MAIVSRPEGVAPFADLPPGSRIPQEWPAHVEMPASGYLGFISEGRVHYVAVDDGAGVYITDRLEEAYRFKTPAALAASFAYLWNFAGLSTRFVSEDGSVPSLIASRVTKPPRRRLEPLTVSVELVAKVLRREAGGPVTPEAASAALDRISGSISKIEADANSAALRSDGHDDLAEGVRQALVAADILPRSVAPR